MVHAKNASLSVFYLIDETVKSQELKNDGPDGHRFVVEEREVGCPDVRRDEGGSIQFNIYASFLEAKSSE